jgi:hypothetical protein
MKSILYEKPLTTDQVTSIEINDSVSDETWKLIEVAVGHGLLHPNVGSGDTDEMPWKSGTFHLAYALAPHFLLLPRRGKSVKLSTITHYYEKMSEGEKKAFMRRGEMQLSMFDKEGDL